MTYSVTLSDGTVLNDLEGDGLSFASRYEVTEDTFDGKTDEIVISSGSVSDTYLNMEVRDIEAYDAKWHFRFTGLTPDEVAIRGTASQLDDVITALFELAEIVGDIDG